jgi:hypothetical protein
VGRFFAIDPLFREYPWNSPYAFSENRVIDAVELEGLESFRVIRKQDCNSPQKFITQVVFDPDIKFGVIKATTDKSQCVNFGGTTTYEQKIFGKSGSVETGGLPEGGFNFSFRSQGSDKYQPDDLVTDFLTQSNIPVSQHTKELDALIGTTTTSTRLSKASLNVFGEKFAKIKEDKTKTTVIEYTLVPKITIEAVDINSSYIKDLYSKLKQSTNSLVELKAVSDIDYKSSVKVQDINNPQGIKMKLEIKTEWKSKDENISSRTYIKNISTGEEIEEGDKETTLPTD